MKAALISNSGLALAHESGRAHVTGSAQYTDDLIEPRGTLHCAPVLSPHAHARLLAMDCTAALSSAGVVAIVTAQDIPGDNTIGPIIQDEPILPVDEVMYCGQVIALVVADTFEHARRAARLVTMQWQVLPAILTIEEAIAAQSFVLKTRELVRGDPAAAMANSANTLSGKWSLGGQEHFYLEGMVALAQVDCALGQVQQVQVHSSTQHPTEVQHMLAHAFDVPQHLVQVQARRLGGAFGGKESQASQVAVWAALASLKTGRPCKLRLDRDDDMQITGKRHDFQAQYQVGFTDQGVVEALSVSLASRCGFSADLSGPVNDRAMFHIDNCYWLPNVSVKSMRCKTHMQSATAFRGFGGPQGMAVIEQILDEVARHLDVDPLLVRQANLYGKTANNVTPYLMTVRDNIAPELIEQLAHDSRYSERKKAIALFNRSSQVIKRGIALTPLKFGISFTATHLNQAGALVFVYADGSVLVNHGGIEMGQGLHTKVLQLVADVFGLSMAQVHISTTDTAKVPNTSATAASSGTDMNGKAAQFAALQIRKVLAGCFARAHDLNETQALHDIEFANGFVTLSTVPNAKMSFADLVQRAYMERLPLWSDGFYATPEIHYDMKNMTGTPFYYFSYGAAVSEVAIDTLTGEMRVLEAHILHDVGQSLNPAIDRGQIEGGFVQGMGWLTTEELVWTETGPQRGRLSTHAPSTYKIPVASDVPDRLRVDFWPQANARDTVFKSKAVGEPPLMLALSVWHAVKDAVRAANPAAQLNAPCTAPEILSAVAGR